MDSLKLFIQRPWPEHKWNPYWPFLAALIGNVQCALLHSFHQKNTVTSQSCCQVRAVIQQCQYRPIAAVRHITKSRTTHQRMSVFRCFSSLLRLYLGPLLFIMALVSWPESITKETCFTASKSFNAASSVALVKLCKVISDKYVQLITLFLL